jgi:hypothetical protein
MKVEKLKTHLNGLSNETLLGLKTQYEHDVHIESEFPTPKHRQDRTKDMLKFITEEIDARDQIN